MDLSAGAIVGSYQIDREISRGRHAVVYRAWQRTVGRWVVLKVLTERDPQALAGFRREIRLTGNIGHGGVRQVYDAGEASEGFPYLAMQYVDSSLRDALRERLGRAHAFSRAEVARYLAPVAVVLDHIHRHGLVHLDVKPENVLIFADGRVLLADFGSACRIGTMTHQGTPRYLSLEHAAGDRPVTPQSDVYSLACVAYEMLAGEPVFGSDFDVVLIRQHLDEAPRPLRQLCPGLSRDAQRAVDAALAKDPRERPPSAGRFIRMLECGRRGSQPAWPREAGHSTAGRSGPKWLVIVGSVALIALVVVVALIAAYWLRLTPAPARTPVAMPAFGPVGRGATAPLPTLVWTPMLSARTHAYASRPRVPGRACWPPPRAQGSALSERRPRLIPLVAAGLPA